MNRRQFVFTAATFTLLTGCGALSNLGKPGTRGVARVGILDASAADDPVPNSEIAGLKQGLAELGYVDGQTIVFELRGANSNFELLPALANELVQLPVNVLVTVGGTPATSPALQATTGIPIVFVGIGDPVGRGFVTSLDHPGGNVTGVTNAPPTVFGKLLEFLAQLVPRLSRVVLVTNLDPAQGAGGAMGPLGRQALTTATNAMSVQLKVLDVRSPEDVAPALADALAWPAEAMITFGGPGAVADAIPRLVDFQLGNRIPMVFSNKPAVQVGGLLSYGASYNGEGRLAATLVDKIIKGAKPADLPVELPTVYELVVNQTTAQALGITIPPEVAQQVTQWIQ
jgi:ABC-type uncharacterized transport system substrate-binding protein